MNFQGPEYLLRALPYRPVSALDKESSNGPQAWELDVALAIVDEAVNTLDTPALQSNPCELVWPEGCDEIGRSTLLYQNMYGAYFPHEQQTHHMPSVWLHRPMPPSCDRSGPNRPTVESNFDKWLQLRKYEWNTMRMQRQDSYAPPLEQDFFGWLNARKSMWRMQRAENKQKKRKGVQG